MAILNIHRVNELPTALEAHALYVLRKQEFGRAELIFTSAEGVTYPILDTASVQNIVGNAINRLAGVSSDDANKRIVNPQKGQSDKK